MSYPIIILVGAVSFVLDINSTPPEELVGEIMHREGVVAAEEETDAMVQDQQGIAPTQNEGIVLLGVHVVATLLLAVADLGFYWQVCRQKKKLTI